MKPQRQTFPNLQERDDLNFWTLPLLSSDLQRCFYPFFILMDFNKGQVEATTGSQTILLETELFLIINLLREELQHFFNLAMIFPDCQRVFLLPTVNEKQFYI